MRAIPIAIILLLLAGISEASIRVVNQTDPACLTSGVLSFHPDITDAINSANSSPPWDEIVVCAGVYTESLTINKTLTLRANNTTYDVVVSSAIFITTDYVNVSWLVVQNAGFVGIYLDSSNFTNLSNNKLTSNSYGIYLYSSNFTNLSNNKLTSNSCGIWLYSSSNNNLIGNDVFNNLASGIFLGDSNNNNLTGNDVYNNSEGIYLDSSGNNEISGNNVSYNSRGIHLYSSSSNDLIGNDVYNNSLEGIYLSSSSNNNLSGNDVYNNSYGIYLSASSYNTLIANNASHNSWDGIYLSVSSSNNISGNDVYNNSRGIYMDSSDENDLLGNDVYNNSWGGIYLFSSNNSNLTGNDVYNNDEGIYLYSSNYNTLLGNNASYGSDGIDLIFSSSNNNLTGNNASYNSQYGIYLDSSSYNDFIGNDVYNNSLEGIYLSSSSNNNLTGNNASYNDGGIYLVSSSNNNLIGNDVFNNLAGGILLGVSSNNNNLTGNNVYNNSNNGIFLDSSDYNNLTNNNVYNNSDYGIHLSSSHNNDLTGNEVSTSYQGIYIFSSLYNNLTANNAYNNSGGIYLDLSNHINLTGGSSYNNQRGIYLVSSFNNTIYNLSLLSNYNGVFSVQSSSKMIDCELNSTQEDFYLFGNSHLTVLNTSFDTFSILDTSTLTISWYLNLNVTLDGAPVDNANVNIYNVSNERVFEGATEADGWIRNIEIAEYTNYSGYRINHTPHSVYAGKVCAGANLTTINITSTRTLEILLDLVPDLTITDVAFSPSSPYQGQSVTITATVWNLGKSNASDVNVSAYVDGIYLGSTDISSLANDSYTTAQLSWTSVMTSHTVEIIVDPENEIVEENETNNSLSRGITVSGCGDGECQGQESCSSCPADCGTCPVVGRGKGVAVSPAYFALSNLLIVPEKAEINQIVTIKVDVENTGGVSGTKTLSLKIDGKEVASKTLTLAVGEEKTISFNISKDTPGTYEVAIGYLRGSFEVVSPTPTPPTPTPTPPTPTPLPTPSPTPPEPWWRIPGWEAVFAVLGLLAVYLLRRKK